MNAQQIEQTIFELANAILTQPSPDPLDKRTTTLRSVIGMVHTIILDGGLEELDNILRVRFPDYYVDNELAEWKTNGVWPDQAM